MSYEMSCVTGYAMCTHREKTLHKIALEQRYDSHNITEARFEDLEKRSLISMCPPHMCSRFIFTHFPARCMFKSEMNQMPLQMLSRNDLIK